VNLKPKYVQEARGGNWKGFIKRDDFRDNKVTVIEGSFMIGRKRMCSIVLPLKVYRRF